MVAVNNNIFSIKNVAEAAHVLSIPHFVLSMDKAVNLPNVMDALKCFTKDMYSNLEKNSQTNFAVARFGNVLMYLDSRKSSYATLKAIAEVTIYSNGSGDNWIFHDDSGSGQACHSSRYTCTGWRSVRPWYGLAGEIVVLTKNFINLTGYKENDIEIEFSEIRPGEKLDEELLN